MGSVRPYVPQPMGSIRPYVPKPKNIFPIVPVFSLLISYLRTHNVIQTAYLLTIITVTYRYTNHYLPLFDKGNNEEGEKYIYLVMR